MKLVAEMPSLSSCTNQEKKKLIILYGINRLDKWRCCCNVVQARIAVYFIFICIHIFVFAH